MTKQEEIIKKNIETILDKYSRFYEFDEEYEVNIYGEYYGGQYTITLKKGQEADDAFEAWRDFDEDEFVRINMDAKGAPSIRGLLNDAESIQEKLETLSDELAHERYIYNDER